MSDTDIESGSKELQVKDHMISTRLTNSLFSKDLAPHYMKLAGQLASSDIVPKCYRNKPSDLFLCWAKGHQLGIPPEQAMDCIAVINGRACMWGDEMLALCMSHPDFQDINEDPILVKDAVIGYRCTIKRKGRTPTSSEFTLDMAKKAGLLAKGGVWNQYPERMLKLRARGFCLRDAFPDALKGIKSREEVEDYIDAEYTVKTTRTAALKEKLVEQEVNNDTEIEKDVVELVHSEAKETDRVAGGEAEVVPNQQEMESTREEATKLHDKIRLIIEGKAITDKWLANAFKFYQVHSIDELSVDSANDMISRLNKIGTKND